MALILRPLPLLSVTATFLLLLSVLDCRAQQEPVAIENADVWNHYIGPVKVIHAQRPARLAFEEEVVVEVVVSAGGSVEWVHAIEGPKELFSAAEAIERDRQFKPFEQDGIPVRARIRDTVLIYPPEQWAATRVPFPAVKNLNTLRMSLSRTSCYGSCPAYSVEVRGNGDVFFRGGINVLVPGEHRSKISRHEVENLLDAFREADYFSLKDDYSQHMTDVPSYSTAIEFDGLKKSVGDYAGTGVGMPDVVTELEYKIDEIAGTEKWLHETDQTWPALVAEHWNVRAETDDNRKLFASVTERGSAGLIQQFLSAGAPAVVLDKDGASPLVNAAEKGDLDLVRRMLGSQTNVSPQLLFRSLRAAAHSGNVDLMEFLISKGANVGGPVDDFGDRETILMAAASRCHEDAVKEILHYHPQVNAHDFNGKSALARFLQSCPRTADMESIFELLVAAGADVNLKNENGETAIFSACFNAPAVPLLANSGADLNVRNKSGETPLMRCVTTDFTKEMIAAGADLYARDRNGQTAAQSARDMGITDKAEQLEAAMKAAKNQQ
jgi:ankyrin repeat protein